MFDGKGVFFRGRFQYPVETIQPNPPGRLVDLEGKVPGPHPGRPMIDHIKRRPAEDLHEKFGRFPRSLLQVGREETPDGRPAQFPVKVRNHAEDILLAHGGVNFPAGAGSLGRTSRGGENFSGHAVILHPFGFFRGFMMALF